MDCMGFHGVLRGFDMISPHGTWWYHWDFMECNAAIRADQRGNRISRHVKTLYDMVNNLICFIIAVIVAYNDNYDRYKLVELIVHQTLQDYLRFWTHVISDSSWSHRLGTSLTTEMKESELQIGLTFLWFMVDITIVFMGVNFMVYKPTFTSLGAFQSTVHSSELLGEKCRSNRGLCG